MKRLTAILLLTIILPIHATAETCIKLLKTANITTAQKAALVEGYDMYRVVGVGSVTDKEFGENASIIALESLGFHVDPHILFIYQSDSSELESQFENLQNRVVGLRYSTLEELTPYYVRTVKTWAENETNVRKLWPSEKARYALWPKNTPVPNLLADEKKLTKKSAPPEPGPSDATDPIKLGRLSVREEGDYQIFRFKMERGESVIFSLEATVMVDECNRGRFSASSRVDSPARVRNAEGAYKRYVISALITTTQNRCSRPIKHAQQVISNHIEIESPSGHYDGIEVRVRKGIKIAPDMMLGPHVPD